jgi:hypothetical protein
VKKTVEVESEDDSEEEAPVAKVTTSSVKQTVQVESDDESEEEKPVAKPAAKAPARGGKSTSKTATK